MTPQERSERVREALMERNPQAVLFDGLDSALVGIAQQFSNDPLAVYDQALILKHLEAEGMSADEAWEFLSYNIAGLWAGDGTPLILERVEDMP